MTRYIKKWFGDEMSFGGFMLWAYIKQILIVVSIIVIVLLGLFYWNQRLKVEVSKRTKELELANESLKSHQEEIYKLAYFDSNTSLPNRLYFVEELNESLNNLKENEKLAVLYIDLDRFKYINDTLGHDIGNEVLKLIGFRLVKLMDMENLVARGGGDEYLVLIKEIFEEEEIIHIVNEIIENFKRPILTNGHKLYLTTSIGIAVYPEAGTTSLSLIKKMQKLHYIELRIWGG